MGRTRLSGNAKRDFLAHANADESPKSRNSRIENPKTARAPSPQRFMERAREHRTRGPFLQERSDRAFMLADEGRDVQVRLVVHLFRLLLAVARSGRNRFRSRLGLAGRRIRHRLDRCHLAAAGVCFCAWEGTCSRKVASETLRPSGECGLKPVAKTVSRTEPSIEGSTTVPK
jgi:hypothetical protein